MQTRIISYYVDFKGSKGFYESCADKFVEDCDRLDIEATVSNYENQGGWRENTRLKPYVIKEFLEQYEAPVLFIDVDSKIHKVPYLVDKLVDKYDMAVVPKKHEPHKTLGFRLHAQLGTLWFNYSQKAFDYLNQWCLNCYNNTSSKTAHQLFADTWDYFRIETLEEDIRVFRLPESYGFIRRRPDHQGIDPVIEMTLSKSDSKSDTLSKLKHGQ